MSTLSYKQLRLEQIGIWADAAAARSIRNFEQIDQNDDIQNENIQPMTKVRFDLSPCSSVDEKSIFNVSTSTSLDSNTQTKNTNFPLCNSPSFERFRKSGSQRALLLAKKRQQEQHQKYQQQNSNHPQLPDIEIIDAQQEQDHFILTKTTSFSLSGTTIKMQPKVKGRRSSLRSSFRSPRRRSSAHTLVANEPKHVLFDQFNSIHTKQRIKLRERDENDFRKSNAKLPERDSNSNHSTSSKPVLGRFTRSSTLQIPPPKPLT